MLRERFRNASPRVEGIGEVNCGITKAFLYKGKRRAVLTGCRFYLQKNGEHRVGVFLHYA